MKDIILYTECSRTIRAGQNGLTILVNGVIKKEELAVLNFSAQNLMATVNDIIDFNNLDNDKVSLKV